MSTTFSALAMNTHVPARAGRPQAHARHAAADRRPTSRAIAGNAVTNTAMQVALDHRRRAARSSASAGRRTGSRSSVFVVARRGLLRVARRRAVARDPELRLRARLRQRRVPAADLHLAASSTTPTTRPAFLRDIAEALPLKHLIDGLSGAMVTGEGLAANAAALAVLALWAAVGIVLAVRGFSWEAARVPRRANDRARPVLHRRQRPVGHHDAAADPRPRRRRGDPAGVDVPDGLRGGVRRRRPARRARPLRS